MYNGKYRFAISIITCHCEAVRALTATDFIHAGRAVITSIRYVNGARARTRAREITKARARFFSSRGCDLREILLQIRLFRAICIPDRRRWISRVQPAEISSLALPG